MSNPLNAHYVFYSYASGNTYVMILTTGPLTSGIKTLPNTNCTGYPIISGSITIISNLGISQKYNIPGGATPFIYNGLWPNAASSPDGAGSPLCQGIGRLFVNFSQQSSNTMVVAVDGNHINVVFDSQKSDPAILIHSIYPPQ